MYLIQDWAGNICFNEKRFRTFDAAWEFLYSIFPDEEEKSKDAQDYTVISVEQVRRAA